MPRPKRKRSSSSSSAGAAASARRRRQKTTRKTPGPLGFWTDAHTAKSKTMWSPTPAECSGSAAIGYTGSSIHTGSIASFQTTTFSAQNKRELKTTRPSSSLRVADDPRLAFETPERTSFKTTRRNQWTAPQTPAERTAAAKTNRERRMERETHHRVYTRQQKIRIDVTDLQRQILMEWFDDARKTFNLALGELTHRHFAWIGDDAKDMVTIEMYLSKKFITEDGLSKNERWKYLLRTPKVIRQQSLKSLMSYVKRFRTNAKKRRQLRAKYPTALAFKDDVKFHVAYKSRVITNDAIGIEKVSFRRETDSSFSVFSTFTSRIGGKDVVGVCRNLRIRVGRRQDLSLTEDTVTSDFKICLRHGVFFLLAPFHTTVAQRLDDVATLPRPVNDAEQRHRDHTLAWMQQSHDDDEEFVAMDPGVRTFLTGYSPEGTIEMLAHNANDVIDPHLKRIDKRAGQERVAIQRLLASKKKTTNHPPSAVASREDKAKLRAKVRRAKRKCQRARRRLEDATRNLHYNVAHRLARTYRVVGLPHYAPGRKEGRKISAWVTRRQHALSYSKFITRMTEVMSLYPGRRMIRGSEAYTTQTCGRCGRLRRDLQGSETYTCGGGRNGGGCSFVIHRDVNGARNFALRTLTSPTVTSSSPQ